MANPIAPASARLNNALTDFASAYVNNSFVCDELSPVLLVDKMTGEYGKRLRIDVATPVDDRVGPRDRVKEITYDVDSGTYSCEGRGLQQAVPKELLGNADAWVQPELFATENVLQRLKLAREIRVAALINTQANWATSNTSAVSTTWDDEVNATPLTDLLTARRGIPFHGDAVNVIGVCSDVVWDALSIHPQILSILGGGSVSGEVTTDQLAKRLRLSKIVVSDLEKNTAAIGLTGSYSRVWSATQFCMVVVPKTLVSTEQSVFSVTTRFKYPESKNGMVAYDWIEMAEGLGGTQHVAAGMYDDEVIVQNDAGYQLRSVL